MALVITSLPLAFAAATEAACFFPLPLPNLLSHSLLRDCAAKIIAFRRSSFCDSESSAVGVALPLLDEDEDMDEDIDFAADDIMDVIDRELEETLPLF